MEKKVTLGEKHAWVKVKIDGIWYNCDPTFDASQYARGELPEYALIPDSKISRNGTARINITGPECTEISPFDKVPDYVKAPTKKEMKAAKKEQEERLKKEQLGEDKQHGFSAMMNRIMDRIKNAFSRKNQKLLDSGQTEKIVNDENETKVAASPKEEKYPSWDLRGYKDAKPIIVPPQIHTNDRKINDKEKDNDGR